MWNLCKITQESEDRLSFECAYASRFLTWIYQAFPSFICHSSDDIFFSFISTSDSPIVQNIRLVIITLDYLEV